jgi:hypothetical protein
MTKAPSLPMLKAEARKKGGVVDTYGETMMTLQFTIKSGSAIRIPYGGHKELTYPEARRAMMGALKALGGGR